MPFIFHFKNLSHIFGGFLGAFSLVTPGRPIVTDYTITPTFLYNNQPIKIIQAILQLAFASHRAISREKAPTRAAEPWAFKSI